MSRLDEMAEALLAQKQTPEVYLSRAMGALACVIFEHGCHLTEAGLPGGKLPDIMNRLGPELIEIIMTARGETDVKVFRQALKEYTNYLQAAMRDLEVL